jgi:hypothetical protein
MIGIVSKSTASHDIKVASIEVSQRKRLSARMQSELVSSGVMELAGEEVDLAMTRVP